MDGERQLLRIAKAKDRSSKVITAVKQIKDASGVILQEDGDIRERWASTTDQIPGEVWKCLGEEGIDVLLDLVRKLAQQEKIPEEWRKSILVLLYKGIGDVQDCGNYRGIKLMSHT
ncbi:hypothetical protein J437_LFUL019066, partial [Ladona fulva]